jgi:YVTN family beta-propeller protein
VKSRILYSAAVLLLFASLYSGCKQDAPAFDLETSGYPDEIGQIMLTNCAISGCHNAASSHVAAGLDLTSWETCMQGDRNGAVVIPYSHEFSTMFMYCNTYADMGAMAEPTMPFNDEPLTRVQMIALRNWINAGAPSRDGKIAFTGDPHRKKYYVTNQGCDVITVIDQATGIPMRYIPVGSASAIESPHGLRLSPDGQYWYVCFSNGSYLEKYRTSDDAFAGRILLGPNVSAAFGSWNTFAITPDSRHAFVVHWDPQGAGRIAWVDLETMQTNEIYQSSELNQTHGSTVSPDGNTLYVTTTSGNFIYKFDVSDPTDPQFEKVVIDGVSPVPIPSSSENGHEIAFAPDGTKYFITCQGTNFVRVFDVATDGLIATIPVGVYPQEIAISTTTPYGYVTCMEDTATYAGQRGSVYAFNWQTNTLIGHVYTGHQPHGIAIDEDKQLVIISNRNVSPGGPAPHHSSACAGRNGSLAFIDMTSFTVLTEKRLEVSVDPYACLVRP